MKDQRRQPSSGNYASPEILADRGSQALEQARFKEAIELFKQAIRQEPRAEWKEGLAAAWCGRARDLAAKSMFKEAAMVFENALSLGGPVRDPGFYLSCLMRDGQMQKAAAFVLHHPPPSGPEHERLEALAAALLVAIPRLPEAAPQGMTPEQARWRTLAVASRAALAAWCEGAPAEEVSRHLNAISLRSGFRSLRLLLKILLTVPADAEATRRVLETIPPGSAFYPLAMAVGLAVERETALDVAAWNRLTPAQQNFLAEAGGLAPPAAQFLARLAAAERGGAGSLFNFLLKQTDLNQADVRSACLNLLPQVPDRILRFDKSFDSLKSTERCRIQALSAQARGEWKLAAQHWQTLADTLDTQGWSAREVKLGRGVIFRHLAELAKKHGGIDGGELFEEPVIAFLKRACTVDPDHLPSRMALMNYYRELAGPSSKQLHRLLDETLRHFPEDALVLQQALDCALARKAYKQAEGYAHRLLTINSINPGVRRQMIDLQISYARKQVRAKRTDLALKALEKASTWQRADAPSARLRIVQGLVALQANKGDEVKLREGVELAGGGVAGWFRARLEAELLKDCHIAWMDEKLIRARKTPPTFAAVMAIISALAQPEAIENKSSIASLFLGMRGWLCQAASLEWKPPEFELIAEVLTKLEAYDLLADYARAARQRDAASPAGLFHAIVARTKADPYLLSDYEEDQLDRLAEAAAKREDYHMINRINRFMEGDAMSDRRVRRSAGHRDLDEDWLEDPDEADAMGLFGAILADMPADIAANLRQRVKEVGRDQAITELVDRVRFKDGPFASLPVSVVRDLCAIIVTGSLEGNLAKMDDDRQRSRSF